MTSKRTTQSDPLSAGGNIRRPRAGGATHSRKQSADVATPSKTETIDREAVARLAYSYWEERGFATGSSEDDWYRAEQEVLNLQRSIENA